MPYVVQPLKKKKFKSSNGALSGSTSNQEAWLGRWCSDRNNPVYISKYTSAYMHYGTKWSHDTMIHIVTIPGMMILLVGLVNPPNRRLVIWWQIWDNIFSLNSAIFTLHHAFASFSDTMRFSLFAHTLRWAMTPGGCTSQHWCNQHPSSYGQYTLYSFAMASLWGIVIIVASDMFNFPDSICMTSSMVCMAIQWQDGSFWMVIICPQTLLFESLYWQVSLLCKYRLMKSVGWADGSDNKGLARYGNVTGSMSWIIPWAYW